MEPVSSFVITYVLLIAIKLGGVFMTSDNAGNAYVISTDNVISKYDSDGQLENTFSDKQSGTPTFVDASNPQKVLVFYKDFGMVKMLDNKMTLLSSFDLHKMGIQKPELICNSADGNFWVYDGADFKLKKVDGTQKIIKQSDDVSVWIKHSIAPDFMTEYNNFIYLSDPQSGIYSFDQYANFYSIIPLNIAGGFQVYSDQFFYLENNEVMIFDLQQQQVQLTHLPVQNVKQFRFEANRLFVLTADGLSVYTFSN